MTYYAVTDDPNELAHWGVLGMKWGVRHDKPRHSGSRKPRSAAYKKAQNKLSKMMKSGIQKVESNWKEYNSPKAKEERFMKKAIQQARNGTLKYGKLTDAQVKKVTNRLALEREARQLGGTENPSYAKRIKLAVGEGIVRGIGQGTGAYIEERFRGRGRTTAEIKADKRKTKYENENKTRKQHAKKALAEEYYKTAFEEGEVPRYKSDAKRAKYLAEVKRRNKESDYRASIQKVYDESEARLRANNDSRVKDDEQRGIRAHRDQRKVGGSAVKNLNAWNEAHERANQAGNDYVEGMNRTLRRIERQKNARAERQFATNQVMQEYTKTQQQRAQEAEVRRNIERQREKARLARSNEMLNANRVTASEREEITRNIMADYARNRQKAASTPRLTGSLSPKQKKPADVPNPSSYHKASSRSTTKTSGPDHYSSDTWRATTDYKNTSTRRKRKGRR